MEYILLMEWAVILDEEFEIWLLEQSAGLQDEVLAHAELLRVYGPALARPRVDTLKGSKHANLKELRIQYRGNPWRILFAFDPKRQAILLVGGNKQSDKRWYETFIPIAEERLTRHLKSMEAQHDKKRK